MLHFLLSCLTSSSSLLDSSSSHSPPDHRGVGGGHTHRHISSTHGIQPVACAAVRMTVTQSAGCFLTSTPNTNHNLTLPTGNTCPTGGTQFERADLNRTPASTETPAARRRRRKHETTADANTAAVLLKFKVLIQL